jgi:hypothetical protein
MKDGIESTSGSAQHGGGNIRYTAPELAADRKKKPTKESDVHALGTLFCEMWSRKRPFDELRDDLSVLLEIRDGHLDIIPDCCPEAWRTLIMKCWERNPANRPTAEAVFAELKRAWEAQKGIAYPPPLGPLMCVLKLVFPFVQAQC